MLTKAIDNLQRFETTQQIDAEFNAMTPHVWGVEENGEMVHKPKRSAKMTIRQKRIKRSRAAKAERLERIKLYQSVAQNAQFDVWEEKVGKGELGDYVCHSQVKLSDFLPEPKFSDSDILSTKKRKTL